MCYSTVTNCSSFFNNRVNKITTFHILEILLIKGSLSFKYFDFNIYQGQNIIFRNAPYSWWPQQASWSLFL